MAIDLTNWAVTKRLDLPRDPYRPPEYGPNPSLMGEGVHPTLGATPPGQWLTTSPITGFIGRLVTTQSGSIYRLIGDPRAEHLDFLKSKGIPYDPDRPLEDLYRAGFIRL